MKIYFVKTLSPCVVDEHIAWHIEHGCVRDIVTADGRRLGVIYTTSLAGHGAIVHFAANTFVNHSAAEFLASIRQFLSVCDDRGFILGTVSENKLKLLKLLKRFGFIELARRNSTVLVQYIPRSE